MHMRRSVLSAWVAAVALTACRAPSEPRLEAVKSFASASTKGDGSSEPIATIDHWVPHTSTVSANAGESVRLFVRERVRSDVLDGRPREAVLMIHGRSVPVLAGMELNYGDYDWALWLARSSGFDVFMLDFQGSGRSPRPRMDDPCNVPRGQQQTLLIPNPLAATCAPSYPFTLNTSPSDLEELDTVVEYIRQLRAVEKVHLIGWSQAAFRIGPYAALYPEKVSSLFFFAPIFNTGFTRTPTPAEPTPMTLSTRAEFFTRNVATTGWGCENQREPGIEDIVWAAIMENDDLGHSWGRPALGAPQGSAPEGVMRVRQAILTGWNADVASRLTVPTLIIRGDRDTGLGGRQDVAALYQLVKNDNKLRFTVECAGHFMNWERQRVLLHQISKEWLKHGRVAGFDHGEFRVDTLGNVTPEGTP